MRTTNKSLLKLTGVNGYTPEQVYQVSRVCWAGGRCHLGGAALDKQLPWQMVPSRSGAPPAAQEHLNRQPSPNPTSSPIKTKRHCTQAEPWLV